MVRFLHILFLAVFACALFFWSLELPNQFGMFEDTFLLKTLFTSLFGDFDPEDRIMLSDVYLAVDIFFPGDLLDLLGENDDCFH